jgi:predicted DCC family thiol-disulfide oxidoreductase YuxK
MDRRDQIDFVDIASSGFAADRYGRSHAELMARLHARLPDGEWVEGVEVFRRMYSAVGFGRVVALSRAPGISALADAAYSLFAKNRLRLTGRSACEGGTCEARTQPVL